MLRALLCLLPLLLSACGVHAADKIGDFGRTVLINNTLGHTRTVTFKCRQTDYVYPGDPVRSTRFEIQHGAGRKSNVDVTCYAPVSTYTPSYVGRVYRDGALHRSTACTDTPSVTVSGDPLEPLPSAQSTVYRYIPSALERAGLQPIPDPDNPVSTTGLCRDAFGAVSRAARGEKCTKRTRRRARIARRDDDGNVVDHDTHAREKLRKVRARSQHMRDYLRREARKHTEAHGIDYTKLRGHGGGHAAPRTHATSHIPPMHMWATHFEDLMGRYYERNEAEQRGGRIRLMGGDPAAGSDPTVAAEPVWPSTANTQSESPPASTVPWSNQRPPDIFKATGLFTQLLTEVEMIKSQKRNIASYVLQTLHLYKGTNAVRSNLKYGQPDTEAVRLANRLFPTWFVGLKSASDPPTTRPGFRGDQLWLDNNVSRSFYSTVPGSDKWNGDLTLEYTSPAPCRCEAADDPVLFVDGYSCDPSRQEHQPPKGAFSPTFVFACAEFLCYNGYGCDMVADIHGKYGACAGMFWSTILDTDGVLEGSEPYLVWSCPFPEDITGKWRIQPYMPNPPNPVDPTVDACPLDTSSGTCRADTFDGQLTVRELWSLTFDIGDGADPTAYVLQETLATYLADEATSPRALSWPVAPSNLQMYRVMVFGSVRGQTDPPLRRYKHGKLTDDAKSDPGIAYRFDRYVHVDVADYIPQGGNKEWQWYGDRVRYPYRGVDGTKQNMAIFFVGDFETNSDLARDQAGGNGLTDEEKNELRYAASGEIAAVNARFDRLSITSKWAMAWVMQRVNAAGEADAFKQLSKYDDDVNYMLYLERAYAANYSSYVNKSIAFFEGVADAFTKYQNIERGLLLAEHGTESLVRDTFDTMSKYTKDFLLRIGTLHDQADALQERERGLADGIAELAPAWSAFTQNVMGQLARYVESTRNSTATVSMYDLNSYAVLMTAINSGNEDLNVALGLVQEFEQRRTIRGAMVISLHAALASLNRDFATPFLRTLGVPPDIMGLASPDTGDEDDAYFDYHTPDAYPMQLVERLRVIWSEDPSSPQGKRAYQTSIQLRCTIYDLHGPVAIAVPPLTLATMFGAIGPVGCDPKDAAKPCSCVVEQVEAWCHLSYAHGPLKDTDRLLTRSMCLEDITYTRSTFSSIFQLTDALESKCLSGDIKAPVYVFSAQGGGSTVESLLQLNVTCGADIATLTRSGTYPGTVVKGFIDALTLMLVGLTQSTSQVEGLMPVGVFVTEDPWRGLDGRKCATAEFMVYGNNHADIDGQSDTFVPLNIWKRTSADIATRATVAINGVVVVNSTTVERSANDDYDLISPSDFVAFGDPSSPFYVYSPSFDDSGFGTIPQPGSYAYALFPDGVNATLAGWEDHYLQTFNPNYARNVLVDRMASITPREQGDVWHQTGGLCVPLRNSNGYAATLEELESGLCGILRRNLVRPVLGTNQITLTPRAASDSYLVTVELNEDGDIVREVTGGCPTVRAARRNAATYVLQLLNTAPTTTLSVRVGSVSGVCPFDTGEITIAPLTSQFVNIPACFSGNDDVKSIVRVYTLTSDGTLTNQCGGDIDVTRTNITRINDTGAASVTAVEAVVVVAHDLSLNRLRRAQMNSLDLLMRMSVEVLAGLERAQPIAISTYSAFAEYVANISRDIRDVTQPNQPLPDPDGDGNIGPAPSNNNGSTNPDIAGLKANVTAKWAMAQAALNAILARVKADTDAVNGLQNQLGIAYTNMSTQARALGVLQGMVEDAFATVQTQELTVRNSIKTFSNGELQRVKDDIAAGDAPAPVDKPKCNFWCKLSGTARKVAGTVWHAVKSVYKVTGLKSLVGDLVSAFKTILKIIKAVVRTVGNTIKFLGTLIRVLFVVAIIALFVLGVRKLRMLWKSSNGSPEDEPEPSKPSPSLRERASAAVQKAKNALGGKKTPAAEAVPYRRVEDIEMATLPHPKGAAASAAAAAAAAADAVAAAAAVADEE
jgi:hypothetical protein